MDTVANAQRICQIQQLLTFRACPVEAREKLETGDVRIALEVTFNRPDLLSHLGVALHGLSRGTHSPDAYAAGYALATAGGKRFETQIAARMAPRRR